MTDAIFLVVQKAARKELKILITDLLTEGADTIISDADFADILRAAFGPCGIERSIIADLLNLNKSTLYRWTEEKNMPQPFAQPLILNKLSELL